MGKEALKTLEDIKRRLAESEAQLREAYEAAKRCGGLIPVTRRELAQLEEMCMVPPQRRPHSFARAGATEPEWEWIRC